VIKLLHTADWQIGKLFGQFEPDDAALLAEARFTTIERWPAWPPTRRRCRAGGRRRVRRPGRGRQDHPPPVPRHGRFYRAVADDPGNHDAGLAESVWTRALRLRAIPPNVTLCLKPEPLMWPRRDPARALTQRITHADLTEWFAGAETPAGLPRIGLAHGSVQGILADGIDSSNPIAAGRAVRPGSTTWPGRLARHQTGG
jgi:hypothetical protein